MSSKVTTALLKEFNFADAAKKAKELANAAKDAGAVEAATDNGGGIAGMLVKAVGNEGGDKIVQNAATGALKAAQANPEAVTSAAKNAASGALSGIMTPGNLAKAAGGAAVIGGVGGAAAGLANRATRGKDRK